jgi:methylated-DNA-[protein]-cysteine S-methyltransferase
MNKIAFLKTPVGTLKIEGNSNGLETIEFLDADEKTTKKIPIGLEDAFKQLTEYFNGNRTLFQLKLTPKGTEFQNRVWEQLVNIPFGKTKSYQEIANLLGDPKVIRAAASANGKNPIAIVIPCHRVIGSDGSLTGYAGGLHRKKWLLDHENPFKQQSLF